MLGSGSIDMALVSTIILALYLDPRFDVFSLPWLFQDHETANRVCDGELGKHAFLYLEQKGLKGLAFGANGFRQLTNSLLPVRTPENLTGVRCRVAGSRIFFRTFELLGADALTMNFGEVFTSLQQGVIDAQENPLSIIYSSRLYEVQPYLTIWNYSYDPLILTMNRTRWNSFSSADQKMLLKSAKEAMDYQRSVVAQEDRDLPGLLSDQGMQIIRLSEEEIKQFKKMVLPVYEEFTPLIGKELVTLCIDEVKRTD
jgi:tripartite ATP-independent transporter DctP family solute receptor